VSGISNTLSDKRPSSMGVLPKVTGLDHVVWLHRKKGDRLPYVEVTPDQRYNRNTGLKFLLEPMVIGPSTSDDPEQIHQTLEFIQDNLVTIMDYWDGIIVDPAQVIQAFRKPKQYR